MKIDDTTIAKLSSLSKLEFKEDEIIEIKKNLGEVLTFMENMNEVSFTEENIVINNESILRKDEPTTREFSQDFYKNNKNIENNQFKVPTVL
jgi:aspartyl-tRNA(Asn)/glutamyl-tRNA(Gln) amidotransferase subunit C